MSNSLQKIRNTLSYSSNIDITTSELTITKNVTQNIDNAQLETGAIDQINAFNLSNTNHNIDANFVLYDIPTNSRVDNDELTKIKFASVYSTGINEDEKTKTLNLVSNIYKDVTEDVVPPDLSSYGFTGFNIKSGSFNSTGFDQLNFEANSGFSVNRDNTKLNVNHNAFSAVSVVNEISDNANRTLNAEYSDTLYIKGDGISFEIEEDEFKRKFITFKNDHQTVSSMEDVNITLPLETDEILMQREGTFKNIASSQVRPAIIYGGEF
jgi:hypothetical protein